jgi:hypothetical protein
MSSTNAGDTGHERSADDFYETPSWCVEAILPHLHCESSDIIDPCAGEGAILRAVDAWCRRADDAGRDMKYESLSGIELDDGRAATARAAGLYVTTGDCLADPWSADLVITNPPFSHAMEMVQRSMTIVAPRCGEVAMLLRLNWLASAKRAAFHREHPADVYILPTRPSFCASITCRRKDEGCGWHVTIGLRTARPIKCPHCGNTKLQVTTTDSIEYCWMVWSYGCGGGRWSILDIP